MRARLLHFRDVAPATRQFTFEANEDFSFIPGQFLSLTAESGGKTITRAYSIASAPDGNRFDLCLNLVQAGTFSPHLFNMRQGDEIDCKGPFGALVFRNPPNDSILVATGTGVTPYRSMLWERLPAAPDKQFTLVFGARHEHGLLYREEFEELAAKYPNFRFVPTLSQPDSAWTGLTGRVHWHVLGELGDRRDVDVYICGMAQMIDELRTALKEKGLDRKKIIVEKYD